MRFLKIIKYFIILSVLVACEGFSEKIKNSAPKTSMRIENPVRHYYPVIRGEKLEVSYKFKNTGKNPLVIRDVQASCGCITTNKFDRPISPDGFGYIEFEYDSSKNIGYVEHHVLIVANIDSTYSNEVKFATNVVPDPLYIKDYEQIYQEQQNTDAEDLVDGDSKLWYYIPNGGKKKELK
jgi:hypothetical protein